VIPSIRKLSLTLLLIGVLVGAASASSLTRPQIIQALSDLEVCLRTMCLPANNGTMGLGVAQDLATKLNQAPNALDQWTLGRLNPVIALLRESKVRTALDHVQAAVAALIRPQVLKNLQDLEVCVRTMCLPAGDAAMGIGYARQQVQDLARYTGPFPLWVTQRLNAAILLLGQKKIREGLGHIQATIRELPAS
jgi:hypothetical protein